MNKLMRANPASMAELFPIRDMLDNIMVRCDGCHVAGYSLEGSMTYYGAGDDRNMLKDRLDSLLRTSPEQSMRVQVRYEVTDRLGNELDSYVDARRTDYEPALQLDMDREWIWRERERNGEYLSRKLRIYFIWDPEAYRKTLMASGTPMNGVFGKSKTLSPVMSHCIRRERQEHEELTMHFEALLTGIESSMTSAELKPKRLTHKDLFNEMQDAIGPLSDVRTRLRAHPESLREISVREQLANVSLNDVTESYMDIDRVLWGVITMKDPPERTFPGIMRDLQTLGFPLTISTNIEIPNQGQVLKHFQRREKKMISAQSDLRGRARLDAGAAQTQKELAEIQARILASSTKACRVSLSISYRTSFRYTTDTQHEEAERQIMARRQQVMHVISRMDGAAALPESNAAQIRMLVSTMPGLAAKDKRDHDVLTANAADMMPVEMPWVGTPQTPSMLFATPYRQLIPYSPFDSTHPNANALIAAASGAGKSMLVQQMLLTMARKNVRVSILESGDSYYYTVKFMGGEMITMSLDSEMTINPFDLEPGQTDPSRDHLSFLRSLIRHMLGDKAVTDSDILDSVITKCIVGAYERAKMRTEAHRKIPLLSDVQDDLEHYIDPNSNEIVTREAQVAAVKLSNWVGDGMYASLFDRYTTVDMRTPWLYFNIEKLKDDVKLQTAMSLLIAYTTTMRAGGGMRCITVLDECWKMLESPSLRDMVVQLYRTARKRDACVWGLSQAVEDFTGTADKPSPIGGAILSTTALRLIGRQSNMEVLREFLHLSPAAIEKIKSLAVTEKGKQSEFLICVGERSETTHSLYIQPIPLEYWLATTYPRERKYRSWWLKIHPDFHQAMRVLAAKFPIGLSSLPELPEERSGEVSRDIAVDKVLENMQQAKAGQLVSGVTLKEVA
jgi:hypothetical protein